MNIRKKLILVGLVLLVFFTIELTISIAKIDPNNTYTLEVDKNKVKANDIITVTLKMKIPNKSAGIQSRISYDSNLTFLQEELTEDDFGDYGVFNVLSDPDLHAVAFAHNLSNNQYVTGDVTVIKLKFKVTGLEGGPYKIAWQDYNTEGYFDIDTVTIERKDIGSNSDPKNEITINDIIDAEVKGEEINYDDNSQQAEEENGETKVKDNVTESDTNSAVTSKNTILPQTGDVTVIIAIVSAVLLVWCIYLRAKNFKY